MTEAFMNDLAGLSLSLEQGLGDFRRTAGLSQESVAEAMRRAGYTYFRQTTVSKIERGERRLLLSEACDLVRIVKEAKR